MFVLCSREKIIPSRFVEPFYAIPGNSDGAYYFATQSGRLFQHTNSANDYTESMDTAWDETAEPIHALVARTLEQPVIACTTKSYFEIKEPLHRKPFDIGPLDQVKPDDPLPTLRRCVQALDAAGLLKPKPKE